MFEARTPEGRLVRVRSAHGKAPRPGDAVTLEIRKDGFGLTSYEWIVGDDTR